MKVKELIELLGKADPEHCVKAFDGDSGQLEEVSGMVYAGRDGIVELCTDEPD